MHLTTPRSDHSQFAFTPSTIPLQVDIARIAALLEPYVGSSNDERLTTVDLQHISTYIDILQRWNARISLTAIRTEEEIVTRHFGESLFAARHLFPRTTHVGATALGCPPGRSPAAEADGGKTESDRIESDKAAGAQIESQQNRGRAALQAPSQTSEEEKGASAPAVADVGSGAGFPGIPLKLWAPQIHLTLIESNHKKSTFLREVARALILTDINIQTTRAEILAATMKDKFDVVTLRAVERFETILPVASSLVAPAGRLALLISSAQAPQACSALSTMTWSNPIPIPQSQSRVLLIGTRQASPSNLAVPN